MSSPEPNARLIEGIAAVNTARLAMGVIEASCACELAIEAVEFIMNGAFRGPLTKACLIEYCTRHGGVTMTNIRRFLPLFKKRTNKCSTCRCPGHNKNYCSGTMQELSDIYGMGMDSDSDSD
jgi:hypothetical protein